LKFILLKNKVVVITGGAQVIGHAIAVKFSEAGANIAIIDIKDSSKTVEEAKSFMRFPFLRIPFKIYPHGWGVSFLI